ncbi:MAG: 4'-phosphopantetheinyl transferase family protein [Polyangiales bacterium]
MNAPPSRIGALFGPDVVALEAAPADVEGTLYPQEEAAIGRAVEKRRRELIAGRVLARRALGELGLPPAPIPVGDDRAPVWPEGVVGSITHTRDYCAVVVARREHVRSLGADAELGEPLGEHLWRRVCTDRERRWLGDRPAGEQGRLAKVVFSVKECLYKAQYPLTHQFLGFQDVEAELDPSSGTFEVTFGRAAGDVFAPGDRLAGRFRHVDGLVLCALTIPAAPLGRGSAGRAQAADATARD